MATAEQLAARILDRTSSHDDAEAAALDLDADGATIELVIELVDRAYGRA